MKSHFTPDPKKTTKRRRINRDAWEVLRERVLRIDRMCVVCERRKAESVHHVVPKDFSGDDDIRNLVALCGSGTTRCHGAIEARDPQACSKLRQVLEAHKPGVLAYVLDTVGQAWLDDRYPLGGPDAARPAERALSVPVAAPVSARSNWFGKPLPGWLSPAEVEAAYADCLVILQAMAASGVAPLARKGGGEAGSALLLVFDDFRDRHSEWLRKGAA